jgi:hypothetical protein
MRTMPAFTIETTYHLPIYRHRTYVAHTLDEACRAAIQDEDWRFERRDYDNSGDVYVSGAWLGRDIAYHGRALQVPSHFDEAVQRKAEHFAVLLGLLKKFAPPNHAAAQAAIATGEAILAGATHAADASPSLEPQSCTAAPTTRPA